MKILSKSTFWKLFNFAIVGAIGSLINLGILYALTEWAHVYYIVSEIAAILCVFVFNFFGNVINGNIVLDKGT